MTHWLATGQLDTQCGRCLMLVERKSIDGSIELYRTLGYYLSDGLERERLKLARYARY